MGREGSCSSGNLRLYFKKFLLAHPQRGTLCFQHKEKPMITVKQYAQYLSELPKKYLKLPHHELKMCEYQGTLWCDIDTEPPLYYKKGWKKVTFNYGEKP